MMVVTLSTTSFALSSADPGTGVDSFSFQPVGSSPAPVSEEVSVIPEGSLQVCETAPAGDADGLKYSFDTDGITVGSESGEGWYWRYSPSSWGRSTSAVELEAVEPHHDACEVSYSWTGLKEVWSERGDGIKQEFYVYRRPDGSGELVIEGTLETNMEWTFVSDPGEDVILFRYGEKVLRYWGLTAVDSAGTTLESRVEFDGKLLKLVVDDEGAVYPIHIDPLLDESSLQPHDPIHITENAGFTPENGVNGGGSGTEDDPYIIENWVISSENAHGIWIEHTTAYFVIRNCLVENGGSNYNGIYLNYVNNGTVEYNVLNNNNRGIYMYGSDYNTISHNTVENNGERGIFLYYSDTNLLSYNEVRYNSSTGIEALYSAHDNLENNVVENNSWTGIIIGQSTYFRLDNNTMSGNKYGFRLSGTSVSYFSSHDIDESNLVNGKPVIILKGVSNVVVNQDNTDIGYLGFISSNNITVENWSMENNGHGLLMASTTNSTVDNCTFRYNETGIYLCSVTNTQVDNCTLENNWFDGCNLYDSDNNVISNSVFEGSARYGVYIGRWSNYNLVENNTFWSNGMSDARADIQMYYADNNTISKNVIQRGEGYERAGISTAVSGGNSHYITIDNNLVENMGCYYGGSIMAGGENTVVTNNTIRYGPWAGVHCEYSGSGLVVENNLIENKSRGIWFYRNTSGATVRNNYVDNCYQGILVGWSTGTVTNTNHIVEYNTITRCTWGIYVHANTNNSNNTFHHNLMYNNDNNASDASTNAWDNGSEGNWWGDWQWENAADSDNDGIFENEYAILGGSNQDNHPLSLVNQILPENGLAMFDNIVYIEWTTPALPVYTVQVDDDPNFSSPEYENTVTKDIEIFDINLHENTTTELPLNTYYWRVLAKSDDQTYQTASPVRVLYVRTPYSPQLYSPPDGIHTSDSTPHFEWENLGDADYYRLLVDNDPDFSSPKENRIVYDNNYTIADENALQDDNYSWKVVAVNSNGENESKVWTFLVDTVPPSAPSNVAPTDGENMNDNTPNLDWDPVTDISPPVLYRAYVDDDPDFSSVDYDSGWISDDNYQLSSELSEGLWYWRVQAKDNLGNEGDNSTATWFRVDVTPPESPALTSPSDGSETEDNTPTFEWIEVSDPSTPVTYDLQVDNDPDFSSPEIYENWVPSTSYTPAVGLPEENYSWRVRAVDNAGNAGGWSSVWTLRINIAPSSPILTWPAESESINDNTPNLDWEPVEDYDTPVTYFVQLDNSWLFNSVDYESGWILDDNWLTPELPEDKWYWRVMARDSTNKESEYSTSVFILDTTPPNPPTIIWPISGENINDNTPNLDWEPVDDPSTPVTYRVYVDNDSDFSSVDYDSGWISDDNYQVPGELAEGTWYWKVWARDNAGSVGDPSENYFTVDVTKPAIPSLTSPSDGEKTTDNTPTFVWTEVSDPSTPVTYDLQVDNDPDFSSPELDVTGIPDNTYTPADGLPDENYSWRVRAVDNAGNAGGWSAVWTLVVDGVPPPTPSHIWPVDGENTNDNTPDLIWGAVDDLSQPVTYRCYVDDDPDFSSVDYDSGWILENHYQLSSELSEGLWYWRVQAKDNSGNEGDNSSSTWFRVDVGAPPAPVITWPEEDERVENTPNLDWDPVSDVSLPMNYRVQIDNDMLFNSIDYDSGWIPDDNWITPELEEMVWYWKVWARDNAGNEGVPDGSYFRVDGTPPEAPSLLLPENEERITDNTPTFVWTEVPDFSSPVTYDLQVDNDPDFSSPELDVTGIPDNTYTPADGLPDENYFWRVRAVDNVGNIGEWSEVQTVWIDSTPPISPSPVSPAQNENTNDNTPNFNWDPVSDPSQPVYYRCHISDDPAFSYDNYDSGWISDDNYQLSSELSEGLWYWRVQAKDNLGNEGDNSSTHTFRVDRTPPFAPSLSSPEDGTTISDNTPTFVWTEVSDSSTPVTYDLQVDNDPDFSSLEIYENKIPSASYTPTTSELPDENYSWRVRAVDNAGNAGEWSSVWTFNIDTGPPNPPILLSPSGTTTDNTPAFTWEENGTDPSTPITYDLQVDNDPDFSSPEIAEIYLTDTSYTPVTELYEEVYSWRVRARDNVGNVGDWSATWTVTVDGTPPVVSSIIWPKNNENTNNNTPNLDWVAASDLSQPVTYRCYVDDDSGFSSVDYDSGWISDDNYQLSSELSEGLWYWYVDARDNLGNVGSSAAHSFRVDVTPPDAVSLSSPANDENTTDNTPTFEWGEAVDASTPLVYHLYVDNDSDFSSVDYESGWISENTYTLYVDEGTWHWKVGVVDNAGNVGENSASRVFNLDATPPMAPPLNMPEDGDVFENTPTFGWETVSDNHPPVLYRCYVDDDPTFSSVDYDSGWISENYYAPASIPEGSWYWRVQAKDNWGNVSENSQRTFDIGVPVWFTGALVRPDNTFVSATIRLYSDSMLRHQFDTGDNGHYNVKIHTGVYDMKTSSFDVEITFENLRVFENGTPNQVFENIFQADNFDVSVVPISETKTRLVAFSIDENMLADNYDRVTITFDYSSHTGEIDNASALTFYRCDSWVFENRTCDGTWTELGGTINLVTHTITITADTFSAYVVAEKETGTSLSEIVEDLQDTVEDLQSSLSNLSDTVGELSDSIENFGSSLTDLENTMGGLSGIVENMPMREPLTVTPSSLSITMYEGEASSGELYIKNNLSSSQTVLAWIENGDSLENFLSFSGSPLSLDSGESGAINFIVYIPMDTPVMMYSGVIKIHSEFTDLDVPVILRVNARKRNLLDLKIMPLNYEVAPGDVVQTEVYLYNMGDEPKVDTNVLLELVDPRTLEVIAWQGEALAVETAMTKIISMMIPEGTEERSYYIRGTAEYLIGLGENVQVVSVASVEVKKPPTELTFFGLPLGILLAILIASVASSAVGVGFYRWERRRRRARKRFEDVVSLSELPAEGPDSAWLGHLAETKRKAFINLDDMKTHVMVAGATGSGKSITAQGVVEEALLRGKNVIVFDPTAQWTGFLRKCKEHNMLKHYRKFGMSESDAKGFPGRVKLIRNPREQINMKTLLSEEMKGKITIFVLENLGPGDMDTFVTNTIQDVFRSQPQESEKLRTLIVYDELHRLLPRFGGEGRGVIQIERGIREFRKWGIGLVLVSQVVSDFEKEIRANIRTQIQMWTREEDELARITEKFGREHMQSISKAPVGYGMMVNSDYNRGKPYYINFKPIRHQVSRLTPEELKRYYKGDERIEDVKFKLKKLEEKAVDVFDMKIELDLAEKKLEEGSFDMVDLYLESLEPKVKKACEKHGLKDIKREKVLVTEEELKKAEMKAVKEREIYEKETPEIVEAYREMLAPVAEIKVGKKIKPFTKKSKVVKRASGRVRTSGKKKVKTIKHQKLKGRKKSEA